MIPLEPTVSESRSLTRSDYRTEHVVAAFLSGFAFGAALLGAIILWVLVMQP